jgi:hypothetical protein
MKLLIVVALLVAACGGAVPVETEAPSVAPPPTPQIVYVTPEPTPEPTPAPTPRPTPTPEPPSSSGWTDFIFHAATSVPRLLENNEAIADAAGAYDTERLRDAARAARDTAAAEVRWLESNPPDACYADYHAAYLRAMRKMEQAFESIRYGMTPPVTWADAERGADEMAEGTRLLNEATTIMGTVDCD